MCGVLNPQFALRTMLWDRSAGSSPPCGTFEPRPALKMRMRRYSRHFSEAQNTRGDRRRRMLPPANMRRIPGTTGRNNPTAPRRSKLHPRVGRCFESRLDFPVYTSWHDASPSLGDPPTETSRFFVALSGEHRSEGRRWIFRRSGIYSLMFELCHARHRCAATKKWNQCRLILKKASAGVDTLPDTPARLLV